MHVSKSHITGPANELIQSSCLAKQSYIEIENSINNMIGEINNSAKNCNGVVPIKEDCYKMLEEHYGWYREKPLDVLSEKGGPIDVYKAFSGECDTLRVGLEFETGNISSAHRSMNKLSLGIEEGELDLAVLLMPVFNLSRYLTDRVSNYEELEPYYPLVKDRPFIILGFEAEKYDCHFPLLAKGKDGMSNRAKHLWKNRKA